MRRVTFVAVCALAVGFAGATASASLADQSLAFKAATVDCHCYPSRHTVALYQVAISALHSRCREAPSKYVGDAWATHNDLAAHGKPLSTLNVLHDTRASIPASLGRTNCGQIMAALAVLMEGG